MPSIKTVGQMKKAASWIPGGGSLRTNGTVATDVQIGTRDSVEKVTLAYDPGTGNLFSVLLFSGDGSVSGVSMNFSSDGGQTWVETASIESDYIIPDVGVTCAAGYFDVAGIYDSSRQVLIDRFYVVDGSPFDTSFAHPQVAFRTLGDEKFGQIAMTSNVYAFNNRVYCATLSNDGHIRFVAIRDTGSSGVFEYASDEYGGNHGLSISFNLPLLKGSFAYIAFMDTSHVLCVDAIPDTMIGFGNVNRHWRDTSRIAANDGSGSSVTSLDDTVVVAYTSLASGVPRVSINTSIDSATTSWTVEEVVDTSVSSSFAMVTMESGNGTGLMYRLAASPAQIRFSYRESVPSTWTTPVTASSLEPYPAQGAISYLGGRDYGFADLSSDSAGAGAAFFSTNTLTSVDAPQRPSMPETFTLYQNYPNPFNPSTTIQYTVSGTGGQGLGASEVRIVIYDVLGREVATLVNDRQAPGTYEVKFDGSRLASGVYFYRLTAGKYTATRAAVLTK